jgi:hypothetical protein
MNVRFLRAALLTTGISVFLVATLPAQPIDQRALQQISALLEEKRSRTPVQQKVDSNLLYEGKQRRGLAIASGVPTLRTGIAVGARGEVVVDITARVTDSLLATIASLGGRILNAYPAYRSIRAEFPLAAVETLAAHPDVLFVQPKQQAILNRAPPPGGPSSIGTISPSLLASVQPGFTARAAAARSQLAAALKRPISIAKVNTSEGVVTHRADLAMSTFGVTGAGVKVGVLSDGVDSLATLQGSGDLPAGVTVLPGQAGSGDEGSAMLEIVYDMAPGAQLYFATASNGIASFAQNIHDLRTAGCDIIIDDESYFNESPFQMGQTAGVVSDTNGGLITQAVNDVTADGALYFSSAANSGGKDKGTSGTWEGDFLDGGATGLEPGRLHNFGGLDYNLITGSTGGWTTLFWSDPLGGSTNDYDLFILDSTGTVVLGSSTNPQNGTQDPFEAIFGAPAGTLIVIVKFSGAGRFLHVDTHRGQLAFSTQGSTRGHNAPPSANAFSVAATPAAAAFGPPPNPTGPYPNPFNSSNHIELFSSDGPRQYFFNADSTPITPGNFSSTGGVILHKPDVTAADGVSCAAPGGPCPTFYGTSAAAPHAGAIAALVKSFNPALTATQISAALTSTAIDIEASGWDRDSGLGILDAFAAVLSVCTPPSAVITAPASVAANSTGNTASVLDAGPGANYTWGITTGTITGGTGTRSITFTAGASGSVGLTITVQNASGCFASNSTSIPIVAPLARAFVSAKTGNDFNSCALGLPCRTFTRALALIQSGGELVVLDSGGYGAFTIAQAVSVVVPQGVYAGITAFSGDAITVSASFSDAVSLQGLTINSLGGTNGIRFTSGGSLQVESSSVFGFADGIRAEGSGALSVRDTRVRNSSSAAVHILPGSPSLAALYRCRLENGAAGLSITSAASVSIEESVASGGTGPGVSCTAGDVTVDDCLLAGNGTGASASGTGTIRISDSCVTDNTTGLAQAGGGTLLSRTDNTVEGNGSNTTGTVGAYVPK